MPTLIPVDHDPFAAAPAAEPAVQPTPGGIKVTFVPVDHDPFAGAPPQGGVDPKTGQPIIDVTAPAPGMKSVAEDMNDGTSYTAKTLREAVGLSKKYDPENVPDWGKDHPNLYGLYGAAKGVAAAGVEGGAAAGGAALGAMGGAIAGPVGAGAGGIAGSGVGFAAGKRLSQAIGLSDEPMDNSAGGIAKDVAIGAVMGAVPEAASLVGKGVRLIPGGDTAVNLLTKAPVGPGMLDAARSANLAKLTGEMDTSFTKAVRPGVAGNRTATQSADYLDNARTAVKEIVLNKDNLGLTDSEGEAVDSLPKSLPQFRQAIDATKKSIWQRVEDINASAGEAGAEVPLQSAVDELNNLATKPVYKTMAPETVNYAATRAKALGKQGSFSVGDAQDAITLANQSLKNFYQNPSSDTASKAYVDSLIANHLRANLDTALEAATGTPAAAPLRQAYGSLKAIEKDVNQRAVVDARKNTKGLLDFSDIYTAGELVKAMATLNPVGAAKTLTWAAVKARIKFLNDPNTHVEKLFNTADKLVSKVDFPLPEVAPRAPVPAPQPPWAGKVNTGGLTQPSPGQQLDMTTNTGGLVQPGPNVPTMDMRTNTGNLSAPSSARMLDMRTNTGNLTQPSAAQRLNMSTGSNLNTPAAQQLIPRGY